MNTKALFNKPEQQALAGLCKPVIRMLLLIFVFFSTQIMASEVTARLDRNTITLGDQATLIIDLSNSGNERPDLSPLKKDFDIVNTGNSTQIQIINGHRSESRELNISLRPRKLGQLTVPAITIGKIHTRPLQLVVKDIPAVSQSTYGQSVWIEMDSPMKNKDRDIVVQQEVPVTVKLFSSLPLNNINLTAPSAEQAIVEKLGDDIQYNTELKGKRYQVIEQHYVLFPEQPGDLTIAPVILRALTPNSQRVQQGYNRFQSDPFNDPFFKNAFSGSSQIQQMLQRSGMIFGQQGKPVTLRSNGLKFDVQHIPDAAKGQPWLPARNVTLNSSWENKPPTLVSGEPAILTMTITADGLTGTQIPALSIADNNENYRVYAEPAEMKSLSNGEHAIGVSKQTFTIIPEKSGKMTFPEIKQAWWNSKTNQLQWAKTPKLELTVKQGISSNIQTRSPDIDNSTLSEKDNSIHSNTSDTAYSKVLFPVLSLLLILISIAIFYYRRKNTKKRSAQTINLSKNTESEQKNINKQKMTHFLKEAVTACETGNSQQAAYSILQWSKLAWPDLSPVSLLDISDNIINGADNIRQLHQYLYQPLNQKSDWKDPELARFLLQGLARKVIQQAGKNKTTLAPLYPA